ncbi:helix-turn-helix domain-containing protein [Lysobacteraceae bacterium NML07-0707]|nr:helix-turn-helix domain-containing protein [Xanthomonadaceae bacterium NML07-0707]
MARNKSKGEPHVRLHLYEMQTPAWQTLSPAARALLLELRALYRPSEANVVFLSVREAAKRLGISQKPTEKAFKELEARGWIRTEAKGGFSRKVKHATSYRLTDRPGASPGEVATKDYMRWRPSP